VKAYTKGSPILGLSLGEWVQVSEEVWVSKSQVSEKLIPRPQSGGWSKEIHPAIAKEAIHEPEKLSLSEALAQQSPPPGFKRWVQIDEKSWNPSSKDAEN
jgi:hypothetical protein